MEVHLELAKPKQYLPTPPYQGIDPEMAKEEAS
jgi:hypothetical protein